MSVDSRTRIDTKYCVLFFPADLMIKGLGEEIIIFVEGLFKKEDRTDEIREKLANQIAMVGKHYFPKAMVECFVKPYDPKLGFAVRTRHG